MEQYLTYIFLSKAASLLFLWIKADERISLQNDYSIWTKINVPRYFNIV